MCFHAEVDVGGCLRVCVSIADLERKLFTESYFRTKGKQQLSPPSFSHLSPLSTSERAEME